MQIIFTFILIILNISLIAPFIIVVIRSKTLKRSFDHTVYYYKNRLGFIISVNGPIRVGKTSLTSGLSHVGQICILHDLQELLEKTKIILYKISFNEVDINLDMYFSKFNFSSKKDYPDFDYITDLIIKITNLDPNKSINNFIGNINTYKLLLDYCQAYFVLYYRNNFVQSKTPFYSHLTGSYNLDLNLDWLKIKEAYINKEYAILDWVVILIDETTDESQASEWQSDLKDKGGAKEYRRKFGQIHQERNRIISTKQDILDEVKRFRNLTHSHIHVDEKVTTTGNYLFIYEIVKRLFNLYIKIHKLFLRIRYKFISKKNKLLSFDEFYIEYEKEYQILKKKNNYLYYLKEFLLSIGYNRYYGRILKRAEDIEKVSADVEQFYFFIPTLYCWGTYDTHLYKSIQKDLINNSNVITEEITPELNPNFLEDLITNDKEVGDFEF